MVAIFLGDVADRVAILTFEANIAATANTADVVNIVRVANMEGVANMPDVCTAYNAV